MIGLPGEFLQGVPAVREGLDFGVHLGDLAAVLFHLALLALDLDVRPDPVEDAAVREEQQPHGGEEELCEKGLLWSSDPFEKAADEIKLKQSVLKAICLHVAHGCNMDCEYCFAGKGDYSGRRHK